MTGQTNLTEGISFSLATAFICIALILIFASLLCNLAIMTTIYSCKESSNPKDWYFLNIALCDIVATLFATLSIDNVLMNWTIAGAFCKVSYAFAYAGFAATVLSLCALTLERYYGICRTSFYQKHSLAKKSKWSIPGIWFVSVLLFAAYFHVYGRETVTLVGGKSGRVCDEKWTSLNGGIYFTVIPLLLLTVAAPIFMTILLVKIIKKLRLSRTPSSGGSAVLNRKRKETVKMVFYMIVVHYICWLPTILLKLADAYGTILPRYWIMLAFFDLPHHARSILYTLIYCMMYPGFRTNLKSMCVICFCCVTRRNTNNNSAANNRAETNRGNSCNDEQDYFQ